MNRQEKRSRTRDIQKVSKAIDKLTERQLIAVEQYSNDKADKYLELYKALVQKAVFDAMREHFISEERANKVLNKANEFMLKELEKNA